MFDFDKITDRRGRNTFKWNKYQGKDILPLWVADTEFQSAPAIQQALAEEVAHGIYGYTHPDQYPPAKLAIQRWLKLRHQWDIELDWIVWTPGVVPAFNIACKSFSNIGDRVLVQSPNYPPLLAAPGINNMEPVYIETANVDGEWKLDLEQLEKEASDPKVKLFLLCNPMNPVGSVISEAELNSIFDICNKHKVIVCSDEIHCDLILDESKTHIPAGKLKSESITLMAASKTFNVAGLGTSFAIIPDRKTRAAFQKTMQGITPWVTKFGLLAVEKAFTECDDWYSQQLDYLKSNRDYLQTEINKIEGLSYQPSAATFLAWVDASALEAENVQSWFEDKGVGPSPGKDFGWDKYARLNFGCPKKYLEQAIERLKS